MPMDNTLKRKLSLYTGEFMAALLIIQPLLDVLSFFMQQGGNTILTTVIRSVLLVAVSLYGFFISDKKKDYIILYAVLAGFWLVHMANSFRTGYADPIADAGEYLKLIQFPLWTFSFITFFRKRDGLNLKMAGVLTINFAIILLIIALSFAVGVPVYTYDYPEREIFIGLRGWFDVPNSQSAILCMLVPAVLLWAARLENIFVFLAASILGIGILFFTGTRMTFYGAIVIAAAVAILLLINRKPWWFAAILLALLALIIIFRGWSPMAEREAVTGGTVGIYEEKTAEIMGSGGFSAEYFNKEEIPPETLEKIKRVYTEIYGNKGVYDDMLLGDLIERFGVERVMEAYDYTVSPNILANDGRLKRLTYCNLIWEEQDILTKLFGFEYDEVRHGDISYNPENDFPAILFHCGYVGTALYLAFILYFVIKGIIAFIRNIKGFFTLEVGTSVIMFAMALCAAQFSGHVLRKPNAIVYFSLAAAMLYTFITGNPMRDSVKTKINTGKYKKEGRVRIKRV